ncbi:1-acyl-sn-glycerol-3-phosphate acyltransferase, partial [Listeria monocytogenes]|nr:1-acyl-sn-glycerol-3-phosphate acyltransferase [Listeria monocytogenes]
MFYHFAKNLVHFILIIIGGRFQVQN